MSSKSNSEYSAADLQAERDRLLTRIEAIKADFNRGLNKDSSERAVELENSEVLNELMRVSEARLAEIDESISRQSGTSKT